MEKETADPRIQSSDFGHVLHIELEIEDGQVFNHALRYCQVKLNCATMDG